MKDLKKDIDEIKDKLKQKKGKTEAEEVKESTLEKQVIAFIKAGVIADEVYKLFPILKDKLGTIVNVLKDISERPETKMPDFPEFPKDIKVNNFPEKIEVSNQPKDIKISNLDEIKEIKIKNLPEIPNPVSYIKQLDQIKKFLTELPIEVAKAIRKTTQRVFIENEKPLRVVLTEPKTEKEYKASGGGVAIGGRGTGGKLIHETHNSIELTYTGDNITQAVYKNNGETVATLTMTYSGSNLLTVTKT